MQKTSTSTVIYFSKKDPRAAGVLWMELMFRLILSAIEAVALEEKDWVFIRLKESKMFLKEGDLIIIEQ